LRGGWRGHRARLVEENLDLFRRMRAGEFPDGAARTLRISIERPSPVDPAGLGVSPAIGLRWAVREGSGRNPGIRSLCDGAGLLRENSLTEVDSNEGSFEALNDIGEKIKKEIQSQDLWIIPHK
jgi:hypothetical protein